MQHKYKIGDYVCTLVDGYALDGTIIGFHGNAEYYAIKTLDGQSIYRYANEIKPSIRDNDFVQALNMKAC